MTIKLTFEADYAIRLIVAGFALILSGSSSWESGWLLSWCGLGCVMVGLGYARLDVGVFGKRADGRRVWLNRLALCPYLLLNYLLWHWRHRFVEHEDAFNEIAPGIFLGRRLLDKELPAVSTVVDMTAEFSASQQARKLNYICVPTLDGCAPADAEFRKLMLTLSNSSGPVYIHCAAGHGRSAMVAVALLVARGLASNLSEAERIVQARRPRVAIKRRQRELLQRWAGS